MRGFTVFPYNYDMYTGGRLHLWFRPRPRYDAAAVGAAPGLEISVKPNTI